ncbi:AAA family ATPase [Portibacter lacus]|uniref:ATPase AAA n=1 Tax=Portibacter lacus TaxID=1099794 RepID=A0AA37SNB6_9BACT|nr:ATP-binding protein [Portibacter lacus]GLR16624.1 ATPase AAA [Portibacter lacus]
MANLTNSDRLFSGRKGLSEWMLKFLKTNDSELMSVIGRRRVGKTFLVKSVYKDHLVFSITGIKDASKSDQLENFANVLSELYGIAGKIERPRTWIQAFEELKTYLKKKKAKKKVIFFDEFPWLSSPRSGFFQAFDHFWNSWAVDQNIIVVICGSAATWMIKNIVNAKGGLHNRVTRRINLQPFTLAETEQFFKDRKMILPRYEILKLYMAFGGIPYYLKEIERGESAIQAIDRICFGRSAPLKNEFQNLYQALFTNYGDHVKVIRALASKRSGLNRNQLLEITGLQSGGAFSLVLRELEESAFISKYEPFDKVERGTIFRLTDFFSYFYLSFMENKSNAKGTWIKKGFSQSVNSWNGYTFENVCFLHSNSIKEALGISGIHSEESSYAAQSKAGLPGTQIDLLIDRADNAINLCEAKFYNADFIITKTEAEKLRNRKALFQEHTKTRKQVILTMITAFGIAQNMYTHSVDKALTMDSLFLEEAFER